MEIAIHFLQVSSVPSIRLIGRSFSQLGKQSVKLLQMRSTFLLHPIITVSVSCQQLHENLPNFVMNGGLRVVLNDLRYASYTNVYMYKWFMMRPGSHVHNDTFDTLWDYDMMCNLYYLNFRNPWSFSLWYRTVISIF